MPLTASCLVLAMALSANGTDSAVTAASTSPVAEAAATTIVVSSPATAGPLTTATVNIRVGEGDSRLPVWMVDRTARPAALPAMYAALGALQALDVYSTRRALNAGAVEANPVMRKATGNAGAMLAVKALSTAGSIYFTERAWKKNRKGAVVLMAIVNGVSAAVVANNLKNAR